MTLCPNCHTIQKAGQPCSICKCPVPFITEKDKEDNKETTQPVYKVRGKDFLNKE